MRVITSKSAKQALAPADAEQAVNDPDRVPRDAYTRSGEAREAIIGVTEHRRLVVVVYTQRAGRIRVVTAWPATGRDLRAYREAGR